MALRLHWDGDLHVKGRGSKSRQPAMAAFPTEIRALARPTGPSPPRACQAPWPRGDYTQDMTLLGLLFRFQWNERARPRSNPRANPYSTLTGIEPLGDPFPPSLEPGLLAAPFQPHWNMALCPGGRLLRESRGSAAPGAPPLAGGRRPGGERTPVGGSPVGRRVGGSIRPGWNRAGTKRKTQYAPCAIWFRAYDCHVLLLPTPRGSK